MQAHSKIALVFGGSRGIGAACVTRLRDEGYQVAWTYVSDQAPEVQDGDRAYRCDVRHASDVEAIFAYVMRDFGHGPNVVVANAGINRPPAPLADFDEGHFRDLMEVNLFGAFNVLRTAARQAKEGDSLIALTTSMVRVAIPGGGPYTASKAAVESLVKSLSKELGPRGVRVNAVAPGPVETDLFNSGKTEEAKQRSASMSPFNRIGQPNEVAEVVSFLASSAASWVHGQIIQPNGGMV
jgi:3-oxoacyl-[acyl-carrier protein] reductase